MSTQSSSIALEVISPEKTLVSCRTGSVELPGTKGRFVVLCDHAPLVSSLEKGEIVYGGEGGTERLAISSGFVEVFDNHVTACVEL